MSEERLQVFTDGGSMASGIGAWAYVVEAPGHPAHVARSGVSEDTTNNRMEMMAVIKALEELEIGKSWRITSDSEYVVKGITLWIDGWMKRGWKNSEGKPVKNRDLWEKMFALAELHNVKFSHCKGHSGVFGNEMCDVMCTVAMQKFHKEKLHAMVEHKVLPAMVENKVV